MKMKLIFLLQCLICLDCLVHSSSFGNDFNVISLFDSASNSTCGRDDNCSLGEHDISLAMDSDPNTWWQSSNGDNPSFISLFLQSNVSLTLTGLQLHIRSLVPEFYKIGVYRNSSLLLQAVFTQNVSMCSQHDIFCSGFVNNANIIRLDIPERLWPTEPIDEIDLIVSNPARLDNESNYHTLAEIEVYGKIIEGFYAKSLDDIRVEGESGILLNRNSPVAQSSSISLLPNFYGRGYAVLNFSSSERVTGQWMLPSLPLVSNYQVLLVYSNNIARTRRLQVVVSQSGQSHNAFVDFKSSCLGCVAALSITPEDPVPFNFSLETSMVTIDVTLSSVNILLDAIVFVPQNFLVNSTSWSECGIVTNNFMNTTLCRQTALQLSVLFYRATYPCECLSVIQNCMIYGGQCECFQPTLTGLSRPIGRQCDLCPLLSYYTTAGCIECTCPEESSSCDLQTGQCAGCPDFSLGRSCEKCVENSYLDQNDTCQPCGCTVEGTLSCNQTTGECVCKDGIEGVLCDRCAPGYFNYSSKGCTECGCGAGSINDSCNSSGQCYCQEGATGYKCLECLNGYFALFSQGCFPCMCSNRTDNCTLASNLTQIDPQELCDCPTPYIGLSCESCMQGYFLSSLSGLCEPCDCNGRTEHCEDGIGNCINCSGNSTGLRCEECLEGMYAAPTDELFCELCPCAMTTATNASCTVMSGLPRCYCLEGHQGHRCDSCANGFFGSPPVTRCTDCTCNGNIDILSPSSCDPVTGICIACINNTTGNECELCEEGFFGNASAQSCQACDCVNGGSNGTICDRETGQCTCLKGVTGLRCDRCKNESWNFIPNQGCQTCNCSASSNSSVCDNITGQCPCRYGVTGQYCSVCEEGFFGFESSAGCSACRCGLGAYNISCHSDGLCECLAGVTGAKCDQCMPLHFTLTSSGCQPCSECETSLSSKLDSLASFTNSIQLNFSLFSSLMLEDARGEYQIDGSTLLLFSQLFSLLQRFSDTEGNTTSNLVFQLSLMTKEEVDRQLARVVPTFSYALTVQEHVISVHHRMQNAFTDAGRIGQVIVETESIIMSQVNRSNVIYNTLSNNLGGHGLTDIMSILENNTLPFLRHATNELEANLELQLQQQNNSATLKKMHQNLNSFSLSSVRALQNTLVLYMNKCTVLLTTIAGQANSANNVPSLISALGLLASASDMQIAEAESLLFLAESDVAALSAITFLSACADVRGSVGGSGSGGSASGSSASGELLNTDFQPNTSLSDIVCLLRQSVRGVELSIFREQQVLSSAADVIRFLSSAEQLNETLVPALHRGDIAVDAILNYSATLDALVQVAYLSNRTYAQLQNVSDLAPLIFELHGKSLPQRDLSNFLYQSVRDQQRDLKGLLVHSNNAEREVGFVNMTSVSAISVSGLLSARVLTLSRAANALSFDVFKILRLASTLTNTTQNTTVELQSDSPSFWNQSKNTFGSLNETLLNSVSTDMALREINSSVVATDIVVDGNLPVVAVTYNRSVENHHNLRVLNSSLFNLQMELDRALSAAVMIDFALQYQGNSSLSYNVSSTTLKSVSLVMKPEQVASGILMSSRQQSDRNETVVLELRNGSILFQPDTIFAISIGNGSLKENMWYQVYATRETDEVILSLTSLPQQGLTFRAKRAASIEHLPSFGNLVHVSLGGGNLGEGFNGCLDRVIVNNEQISLFNSIQNGIPINTCGPRPPFQNIRSRDSGVWLYGSGSYISLMLTQPLSIAFSVQFSFSSFADQGILLFAPSDDRFQYFIIYLADGRIALNVSLSAFDFLHLETNVSYNTGQQYNVSLSYTGNNVELFVNEESRTGNLTTIEDLQLILSGELWLGGLAQNATIAPFGNVPSATSVPGCIYNLQVNGNVLDLQTSESNRVDFNGCPNPVATGVRFMGTGQAELSGSEQELFNVSLAYRTTQLASLLLNVGNFSISIFHSKIRVDILGLHITSVESNLSDNFWHTVFIDFRSSENVSTLSLSVDDGVAVRIPVPGRCIMRGKISVGGTSSNQDLPITEKFRGCMDSFILNGRELDFREAELSNVSLHGCHPANNLPPMVPPYLPTPPPLPPPPSLQPSSSIGLSGRNGTFISFAVDEDQVIDSFSTTVDFQTISSDGLLLFMLGSVYPDFFTLQLNEGHLLFDYDLGSGRAQIRSNGTYNDGLIHRVQVQRSGRVGWLTINNGSEHISGTSPGTFFSLNIKSGSLFVGGVPSSFIPLSILTPAAKVSVPALACIHALAINGVYEDLAAPQASTGIDDCLPNYNSIVSLYNNSYLRIVEQFDVGVHFIFSINFLTTNCSGVILYVASSIYTDHLLVELRHGVVVLVFDNGPRKEVLQYSGGQQLCDGRWHSLKIAKQGQKGSISIDGGQTQSITSSCRTCHNFFATNTNGPLFVGGISGSVRSRHTVESGSFRGCLSNLMISRDGSNYKTIIFSQAVEQYNVAIDICI